MKKNCLATLFIIFSSILIYAQQPNDCVNAVTVCGNSNFLLDVNGIGTQELSGNNSCGLGESNSLWLEVNIATSGTLAFTLTPSSSDINEDYDFYIYGPNATCSNLGQSIRCSTTNPAQANQGNNLTGLNTTSTETSEGPGGNGDSFVSSIDVLAGESYFIVLDRPIGSSPFSIEWTGTASFPDSPTNPLLSNPNITSLPNLDLCDNLLPLDDNITRVDLTRLTQNIINGESDISVTYHTTESNSTLNIDPLGDIFTSFPITQTVFVRIENTTTGCYILDQFDIYINSFSDFIAPSDYEVCDDDLDGDDENGIATFDFNIKSQEITNGFNSSNYNITYYLSQENAENSNSPLPYIYTNTTATPTEVFSRIEYTDEDNLCVSFASFNIIVAEKPIANDVTLTQCDEDGIPEGFTTFNITEANEVITENTPNVSVKYYLSEDDAQNDINELTNPEAFDNFFNPQIIYTRVTNTATDCINFSEISLEVSTTSINNATLELCDTDGTEDGFMNFDLSQSDAIILAGAPVGLDLQYYETYEDALLETFPLTSSFTNTVAYNQTIFARVENSNACFGISEIELRVFELPNIETENETLYCLNFFPEPIVLDGGIQEDLANNYLYSWSTGENTSTIEVNDTGTYTVRVTNTNGCFKDRTIYVAPSNIATIENIEIVDASSNNSISVFVTGEGDYEYAIDNVNGPYQDSPIFENVEPGFYTVFVRDKNNCGIAEELVSVIGFPKFFTPNNDTVNDFWQVYGISNQFQQNSIIYIFDRYGKLLSQLDPLGPGWDGMYNSKKMPTDDYWFKVTLDDGRTFTSHFALKR